MRAAAALLTWAPGDAQFWGRVTHFNVIKTVFGSAQRRGDTPRATTTAYLPAALPTQFQYAVPLTVRSMM